MGENPAIRNQERAALQFGLDLGLSLIDTAEMYGEGLAEELIGEAIGNRREQVFLVSKIYPHHASRKGVRAACERSLRRLRTDYLDLYLLHWPGTIPLADTLEGFAALKAEGLIRDYGISNFDIAELQTAQGLTGGDAIVTNQVLYNLAQRGIEWDLLPHCRARGISIMAYSPIEHAARDQSVLLGNSVLAKVAERHGATPAQIALAWLLQQGVVVIPKASRQEHIRENRQALDLELSPEDLQDLDQAFPPPQKKCQLAIR